MPIIKCVILSAAWPQFTSQPDSSYIFDIDDPMSCRATGIPPPTISLYGPNHNLPVLEVSGNELVISNVSTAGQYSCVATNSVGQSVVRFYIFVQGTNPLM